MPSLLTRDAPAFRFSEAKPTCAPMTKLPVEVEVERHGAAAVW